MKKLLLLFLAVLMLAGCLSACGKKDGGTSDRNTTLNGNTGAVGDDKLYKLHEDDYSGQTYTILYRNTPDYRAEWVVEDEDQGSTIGSAVFARNSAVEERYKITLDLETGATTADANTPGDFENNFQAKIDRSVLAGDDIYQLAAGYTYRLATISTQGNFLNWYSMPYMNLDEDWWSTDFFTYASYKGCCYIGAGPLSLTHMKASACIYFNINQLNESVPNGTEQVFQEVRDGTWTIDRLMEYAKECTPESAGSEEQRYGFSSDQNQCIDAFIYAFDLKITTYDAEGTPRVKNMNASNPIVEAYEKLKTFLESGTYYSNVYDRNNLEEYGDGMVVMLKRGRSVFAAGILDRAAGIRSEAPDIDYGILPYPKWNEDQENYCTYKTDSHTSFAIPKAVRDTGFVGAVTDALAYYSNLYVKDALYNVVLKYRDATDEESSRCVDIILSSGRYDFSNIYAGAWGDQQSPAHLLRQCLKNEQKPSIVRAFEANKSYYNEKLENFLEYFKTED